MKRAALRLTVVGTLFLRPRRKFPGDSRLVKRSPSRFYVHIIFVLALTHMYALGTLKCFSYIQVQ